MDFALLRCVGRRSASPSERPSLGDARKLQMILSVLRGVSDMDPAGPILPCALEALGSIAFRTDTSSHTA